MMNEEEPDVDLREAVDRIFNAYDADGSGKLDISEVITLINDTFHFMKQNRTIDEEEVSNFITRSDHDGDGKISGHELFTFFKDILIKYVQQNKQ